MKDNTKTFNKIKVKRSSTEWKGNPEGRGKRGIYWVSIKNGFLYLSYKGGRSYWVLSKIKKKKRPLIRAADGTKTIWINSYGIKFENEGDYEFAKDSLENWSR